MLSSTVLHDRSYPAIRENGGGFDEEVLWSDIVAGNLEESGTSGVGADCARRRLFGASCGCAAGVQ